MEAYEDSVDKSNYWCKCTYIILILGVAISLFLLGEAFASLQTFGNYWTRENHILWERFALDCSIVLSAITCGWLAVKIRPLHALPAPPEEEFYKAELSNVNEETGDNDELVHQEKRLAAYSLALFLASDIILISF